MKNASARTPSLVATLDTRALRENYRALTAYIAARRQPPFTAMPAAVPPAPICVVKANAYGHGLIPCVRALVAEGADFFAVACEREALDVRRAAPSAEVLVLAPVPPANLPLFVQESLIATVADEAGGIAAARAVAAAVRDGRLPRGAALRCHIKLDSGMNRLGFSLAPQTFSRSVGAVLRLAALPELAVEGVFSHLAAADEPASPLTFLQSSRFFAAAEQLKARLPHLVLHLANSAAALRFGAMGCARYRLGIALYGIPPSESLAFPPSLVRRLRAPLSLDARIQRIAVLHKGEWLGYGGDFYARRDMRIAAVGIGYADGLLRACTGGTLLLRGKPLRLIGRISMDRCTVALGDLPARVGAWVSVFEPSGQNLRALAARAGTIPYELLTLVSPRAARRVIS